MIRTTLLALAASTAMVGTAFAAPVQIDSFATDHSVSAPSGGFSTVSNTIGAGDSIGGARTITAQRTAGTNNVQAQVAVGQGLVSAGSDTEGVGTFSWGTLSDLNADLVDGTNAWIDVAVTTTDLLGATFSMMVNGISAPSQVGTTGTLLRFNFSDFAGVNFTDVDTISLSITGRPAFDAGISFIGADGPAGVVPLPAAGFLALGGIGALAGLRRRKG